MKSKSLQVEYKDSWIDISVPETANVIQYGTELFPEIPAHFDPESAVRKALQNPIAIEPIPELVKKGSKVTIAFDDPVKHPDSIKIIIPIIVEELQKAGVNEKDINLICATGAHCKWRPSELRNLIGAELYDRFHPLSWREGAVFNHDCTQGNVYLGETDLGDEVEYDKALVESDLLIYVGTVYPVPYGGYSGQGVVIGLGSMRALNSLHSYDVYKDIISLHGDYRPDKNIYRKHKLAVHEKIEKAIGKKIFYVDAITGPKEKIVNVYAGHVPDLEEVEYAEADRYFKVKIPQADILIMGMPHIFDYDLSDNPGCACNYAARPARMWQNKPLLSENGVTIILGQCTGAISPRRPADPEAYNLYRSCVGAKELYDYVNSFCNNQEYIYKYRYQYAYSPIHSLFLMANMDTLQQVSRHTIFVGEINPGTIRDMGATPARDFDEALSRATAIAGKDANILVLPSYSRSPKPLFDVV